ncbi:nitrite reductase [Mycolicibacterium mengxianglii]|uniref:nitrite reductase n=1 Tax=Mycolicibacterium mengxianglii TaxID=2736649 RepID=UPI0018D1A8D9|nr:nitrite reductase [Mycolicibacterium mengxianglii]
MAFDLEKSPAAGPRTRADLCPGVHRPWRADDGLLVRLRLVGGRLPVSALRRLLDVSERFSDGCIHLTARANLQVRGLPGSGAQLTPAALAALESTGLLPSETHELVRNILVSPQTGFAGGRADMHPVAQCLDAALCADNQLGRLPGRFLFTLDDGRGDLLERLTGAGRRGSDLGLVALNNREVQLRIGDHWGEVVRLDEAALHLAGLATAFLSARGSGADAPWHLRELPEPLRTPADPDPRLPSPTQPLPYGAVPGGTHLQVPDGVLTPAQAGPLLERVTDRVADVVVTPWHGIFVPLAAEDSQ